MTYPIDFAKRPVWRETQYLRKFQVIFRTKPNLSPSASFCYKRKREKSCSGEEVRTKPPKFHIPEHIPGQQKISEHL